MLKNEYRPGYPAAWQSLSRGRPYLGLLSVANGAGSSQKYLAMAEVINHRFSLRLRYQS
jgi:hypothetical protein